MSAKDEKDIVEIRARMERMEQHFRIYKEDVAQIKDSVKEIRLLLGGSELNGNKGFIKLMETIVDKVDCFENEHPSGCR